MKTPYLLKAIGTTLALSLILASCASTPKTPWGNDQALYQVQLDRTAKKLGVSAQDPDYRTSFDNCATKVSAESDELARAGFSLLARQGYRYPKYIKDLGFEIIFNKNHENCISQELS